jgi:lipoprotein-releasing system ATP-binding protein
MNNNMDNTVLLCEGVGKYYRDGKNRVDVLSRIDLQVRTNDRIAIIGDSGSGKSTLLHIMGGLDTPTSGRVLLNGTDLSSLREKAKGVLRNKTLGFVYQFHHLLPEFTAFENVAMPLLARKNVSLGEIKKQVEDMLQAVGLGHRMTHKPSELSGGERQRAAIARALVTRPQALLADEPTGNLDRRTAEKVFDLMLELNQNTGTSLVIVTHDVKIAQKMDKIYVLEDGVLKPARDLEQR